jgi:hypothetical protein
MSRRSSRNGVLIPGLILIGLGAWFLFRALGIDLPGMEAMWPIFPVIVGLSIFAGWLFAPTKRGNHGMMIPAVITFLVGVFFFGFTFGVFEWGDMAVLWPVFPLIVGVAFIVAWIFSLFRDWGLLIPGGITAGVGIVGLGFTVFGQVEAVVSLLRFWPVLLIGLGILVLIGGLVGSGRKESTETQAFKGPEEG